jgi:hopanoid biosynthesis associated protein HpnK
LKRLIVTADDFGLAPEVNEAIEFAHGAGILSAASLMVAAPAAGHAIRLARRMPRLRVGLHLVLVDGAPALPAQEVTELVDAHGMLRGSLFATALRLVVRPLAREQIAKEVGAQFIAFRGTGLALDHVNAHRHFHAHPIVARCLVAQARENGARAIRVPLEPVEPLMRVEPTSLTWPQRVMIPWARRLREHAHHAGLHTTDATFGIRWSGQMSTRRLSGLLMQLPGGLCEVYMHPATSNVFAGFTPGYHYTEELAALVDPGVVDVVKHSAFRTGGYQDFLDRGK